MMRKVLVTGATGLLGAHLTCRLLLRGNTVVALKREPHRTALFTAVAALYNLEAEHHNLHWKTGALEDVFSLEEAMDGVDTVFHCAAYVSFYRSEAARMLQVNGSGTANVVNACLRSGKPYLVHVSSIAALGRSAVGEHISENTHWSDSSLNTRYAVSKHLSELEVWRGFEEGLPGAIVNPGIIIGAGDGRSGSNMFFHRVKKGLRFYPTGINGFVSVENTVDLMLMLAEKRVMHERFIAVSENLSYQQLLGMIADSCGVKKPNIPIAGLWFHALKLLTFLAEPLFGKRLPVSYENIRLSHHKAFYGHQKAAALGMHFEPVADSVKRTARQLGLNA